MSARDEVHRARLEVLVKVHKSAIVHASAGTGKTFSLVATLLHMMAGVGRDRVPVAPGRLCAITFTEKAAAEMRERVRARVLELVDDPRCDDLLASSAASQGMTLPDAAHWRRIHRDLGAMVVTTFHGFCAQILREHPVEAGVDPSFGLADELLSQTLLAETVENVVYERLSMGDGACLRSLRALPMRDRAHGAMLVDFISKVLRRVREDGQTIDGLLERYPPPEPEALKKAHDRRLQELAIQKRFLSAMWARLDPLAMARGGASDRALLADLKVFALEADELQAQVEALAPEDLGEHLGLVARYARPLRRRARQARVLGRSQQFKIFSLPTFQDRYLEKLLQHTAELLRADFLEILAEVERRYSQRKRSMGVLDFTDLILIARDTLRSAPQVRRSLKRRFELLLVDEFQDTNDAQLDLVMMLGEATGQEAALDAQSDALEEVRLAGGRLFLVGDPKQSIYNFRGADVTVFKRVKQRLVHDLEIAQEHALQVNRRSVPGHIRFGNRWFLEVLGQKEVGDHDATVRFEPKDELVAHRDTLSEGRVVEFLAVDARDPPEVEAAAVARWIERFVRGDGDFPVSRRRFGDIAILLRQFKNLSVFQDALQRHQIPYFVVKGRGFYGCPEIRDLHLALRLLLDVEDGLALVGVLRSPLFLVSDEGLVWLQRLALGARRKPLSLAAVLSVQGELAGRLRAPDQRGVEAFVALYTRLLPQADRLGPQGVLDALVGLTHYREKLAGTFRGRQKIGNVEKLLELAGTYERTTYGHLSSFERRLAELIEQEPREPEGQVVEESADVVRLMTIHQSKGLEFPVVMVPELHSMSGRRLSFDPVQYDRVHGLQVRQRVRHLGKVIAEVQTEAYDTLREAAKAREDAEEQRLIYVAATRARDMLWLSGRGMALRDDGSRSELRRENPLATLQALAADEDPDIKATCRERSTGELMPPAPCDLVAEETRQSQRVETHRGWQEALSRGFDESRQTRTCPTVAVTQLGDFHRCPHRYFLWYIAGLRDEVYADDAREWDQAGADGVQAILDRGTAAHAALEHLDFDLYERSSPQGRARLIEEQLHAHDVWMPPHEVQEVTDALSAFLETSGMLPVLAQAQRRGRLAREVPFLLHLSDKAGAALTLRGQIDLVIQDEDGGALVLDYKFSRPSARGLAPYQFQLQTYALAARTLYGRDEDGWRAGIVYLRQSGAAPAICEGDAAGLDVFRKTLPRLAGKLVQCRQANAWPRETPEGAARTLDLCEAEGCDFRQRCFGQHEPG